MFSQPATADALTGLFLRSRGVKFRDAVDAVLEGKKAPKTEEPRYGGVWNRLLVTALDRLRRRVPPRLLGSAIFALISDPGHYPNCLVVVKRHRPQARVHAADEARVLDHDYVYRTILERPAPSCSVIAPSLEVLFFGKDQLPSRSEVTPRHFVGLQVETEREIYEVLLGTMRPAPVQLNDATLDFVGRILDVVFIDFEKFHHVQSTARFETATEPGRGSADDLQVWLIAQLLDTIYPGSLCEVIETPQASGGARALASSTSAPAVGTVAVGPAHQPGDAVLIRQPAGRAPRR